MVAVMASWEPDTTAAGACSLTALEEGIPLRHCMGRKELRGAGDYVTKIVKMVAPSLFVSWDEDVFRWDGHNSTDSFAEDS